MPWYQTPSVHGYWGWHWTMDHFNPNSIDGSGHRSIASHYYPLTGPYDSKDPLILEYQTLLMVIGGIDGVLVDWYGLPSIYDYGVLHESTQALFTAAQKAHLSFALVYEDQTVKHMVENSFITAQASLSYGKSVMNYVRDTWAGSDTYLKLSNRPVILTFGPQYFYNSSDWDTLFSGFSVPPLFFTLDNRLSPVAAGAYPWPPMWKSDLSGNLSQTALNDYLNQFYLQSSGWPYLVTSAFPGFHDIYKEAGVGNSYGYLDAANGFTFRSTLQQSLSHNPQVIQIVTWNDYGEGTIIEPTEQFGYQYLEILQAARDSLDPAFPFQKNDLALPLRLYNARRQFSANVATNSALDRIFGFIVAGQRTNALSLMDSLVPTTKIPSGEHGPGGYFLSQNFPNPFNPATVIGFQLPVASHVRLQVFDMLGRNVATPVDEERQAGTHQVEFPAAGLSSGVYTYRITSVPTADQFIKPFVQTRRMVLVR